MMVKMNIPIDIVQGAKEENLDSHGWRKCIAGDDRKKFKKT